MSGKAQVTDSSLFLLLHQIVENTVFLIQIRVNVHLTHVVEQVKIKIVHLAFFQLFFKYLFRFIHIGKVIPREFCSQIIGTAWVLI